MERPNALPDGVPGGQQPPINPATEEQAPTPENPARRRGCLGRLGCAFGVSIWAVFMMIPFFLIVLAVRGDIAIWHGAGFPAPDAHPVLQVKLIMEIDTRGLNITSSAIRSETSTNACVQTDVRYVLWQGEGDPATYCDCYVRDDGAKPWQLEATTTGACGG